MVYMRCIFAFFCVRVYRIVSQGRCPIAISVVSCGNYVAVQKSGRCMKRKLDGYLAKLASRIISYLEIFFWSFSIEGTDPGLTLFETS
jgi:hypothetical protein